MPRTIELPEPIERQLADRATKENKAFDALAIEMIQRGMTHERTFAEILAPFRQSVAESGITDEELDALFRETIDEVRAEKRRKTP